MWADGGGMDWRGLQERVSAWIGGNANWMGWLFGLSLVVFLGSLLVVPWLVARLPADYFSERAERHSGAMKGIWRNHRGLRWGILIFKNLLGLLLLVAGLAMLVLPGQGLLTLFVSLMLLDFPGKIRLERAIVSRPNILKSINWLRRRHRRPPLEL